MKKKVKSHHEILVLEKILLDFYNKGNEGQPCKKIDAGVERWLRNHITEDEFLARAKRFMNIERDIYGNFVVRNLGSEFSFADWLCIGQTLKSGFSSEYPNRNKRNAKIQKVMLEFLGTDLDKVGIWFREGKDGVFRAKPKFKKDVKVYTFGTEQEAFYHLRAIEELKTRFAVFHRKCQNDPEYLKKTRDKLTQTIYVKRSYFGRPI